MLYIYFPVIELHETIFFILQGLRALWLAIECVSWKIITDLVHKTKYRFLVEVFMSIQDQMELQFLVQVAKQKIYMHLLLMLIYLKQTFFIVQLLPWVITRYTDKMLPSFTSF